MIHDPWLGSVGATAAARAGAVATYDALTSITTSPATVASLSAPSSIGLNTLRIAVEQLAGGPLAAVSSKVLEAIAEQAMQLGLSMIGDISGAMPVVGQMFAAVVALVQMAQKIAAENEALQDAYCRGFLSTFQIPLGTGSRLLGQTTVPADFFARVRPCDQWHGCTDAAGRGDRLAGQGVERSWLGQALMRITEGDVWDYTTDFDWPWQAKRWNATGGGGDSTTAARLQHATAARSAADLARLNAAFEGGPWKKAHPGPRNGVPKARRAQFRALRRAIEASPPESDGGVSLWPVYLDLLLDEFDSGRLTAGYAGFLLAHTVRGDPREVRPWGWFGSEDSDCYFRIVRAITDTLEAWRASIHPRWGPGKAKMEELERKAAELAAAHGARGARSGSGLVLRPLTLRASSRRASSGSARFVLVAVAAAAALYFAPLRSAAVLLG